MEAIKMPETLNGYPVIGCMPRKAGGYVVLVYRKDHPVHEYVTAAWHPTCGDSWCWGHYLGTLDDAKADMVERADGSAHWLRK